MADYFDFMGDYGLDQATNPSSEQAEHPPNSVARTNYNGEGITCNRAF